MRLGPGPLGAGEGAGEGGGAGSLERGVRVVLVGSVEMWVEEDGVRPGALVGSLQGALHELGLDLSEDGAWGGGRRG